MRNHSYPWWGLGPQAGVPCASWLHAAVNFHLFFSRKCRKRSDRRWCDRCPSPFVPQLRQEVNRCFGCVTSSRQNSGLRRLLVFLGPRPAYGKFFKLRNDMTWWHACWIMLNPWCGSLWHQILGGQWRCIKMSCRMWEKSWHCWPWCLMPSSLAIKGSLGIWWES